MSLNDAAEIGFVTAEGEDVDVNVYNLGITVPAGRRLYVANRRLRLTENAYTVELVRPADGFSGGTQGYHSILHEGGVDNVQARVMGGVTPAGTEEILSRDFIEAGNQPGESRPVVRPDLDVALRSYISPFVIRITRFSGGTPFRISLNMVGYEIKVD